MNRRNALVLARSEYCNTKHSAADPLKGTELGKQMESGPASAKDSTANIALLAAVLFTDSDTARVHIALDWPAKYLKAESKTKSVLGIVLNKEGSLLTRFSDIFDFMEAASRYETQLTLPPGEYHLRVVLSDGTTFGRAEVPFAVDAFDPKVVAITPIALCKRIQDASAYSPRNPARLPGAWTAKLLGNYVPLVSNDIEFKPTADTRFKKGDTLYTFFEVYQPSLGGQSPAAVEIQIRIIDLKTGEIKSDSQPISAMPYLKAGSPVIPIGRGIDISKLPKGSYRLDVQATDSADKSTPWRSVNFTVE